jgi:hypothetical protein
MVTPSLVGWAKARTQTSLRSLRKLDCAAPCIILQKRLHVTHAPTPISGQHSAYDITMESAVWPVANLRDEELRLVTIERALSVHQLSWQPA